MVLRAHFPRRSPPGAGLGASVAMNRLTKAQKDKVRRFVSVADADEAEALAILKEARWDLEVGLEMFFTGAHDLASGGAGVSEALEATYAKYKAADADEDMIDAAGIERFCEDIGIDPVDPVILVVSCKMGAKQMGAYARDEFVSGMRRMGADTAEALKTKLPELRAELDDQRAFKEVYEFSFDFSKELNHKSLAVDTARAMWKVLLDGRWALVDEWCEFLAKAPDCKVITRDTWSQALEFSRTIAPDMEGYDPAGAWPYLIDEFVEQKLETIQAEKNA